VKSVNVRIDVIGSFVTRAFDLIFDICEEATHKERTADLFTSVNVFHRSLPRCNGL